MKSARASADRALTEADWREAVRDALGKAVDRRRVADVPVGVLLSGGLDSSLLVALLAELGQKDLKTFSVGFETVGDVEGDEFRYSDLIAQRFATDHHRIRVDGSRAIEALPGMVAAMSEPMMSHDAIGFYLLSQEVVEIRQGRAERAGRRRDFRRLSLVSGADALERRDRGLCPGLFRSRSRRDGASCSRRR